MKQRDSTLNVQLKIDTGMGRLGLVAAECDAWISEIKKLTALKIEGVFSHFSHAESVEGDYTRQQLEIFKRVVERLRAENIRPSLVHFANSAATITLPAAYFDMVRPGIMLYGVYPSPAMASQISSETRARLENQNSPTQESALRDEHQLRSNVHYKA